MGERIRVALAIGNEEVENWLKDKVSDYCQFVGIAVHRGQILTMCVFRVRGQILPWTSSQARSDSGIQAAG